MSFAWTLAIVFCSKSVGAQTSVAVSIVPPKPAGTFEVVYPSDGQGEAVVLLHLTVTVDGSVSEAQAVKGDEPFASVARKAALHWRFEPALRDGKAVAARIRFEVRFVPPEPEVDASSRGPDEAAKELPKEVRNQAIEPNKGTDRAGETPPFSKPSAQTSSTPLTVFVIGEKPPPSVRTFTRAEVRQLAGAFGDPFRAIEVLPGVTPIVSGLPFFFVRGAPPGNVGYFLDGIRVPMLYHVALGPSVVHPAIVSRVDLHSGGYPAQFGRFTGGIVEAQTTKPPLALHGEASIRLVDTGLMLEDAWSDGRTTAGVGGRYSYAATALSLLSPEVVLGYWDYQVRVGHQLNHADTIGLFSFGAYDFLGENDDGETETVLGSQFHRVDFRFDHRPTDREHLRGAVLFGIDRTDGTEDEDTYLQNRMVGARLEWKKRASKDLSIRAGADALLERFDVGARDEYEDDDDTEPFNQLFPSRSDFVTGAHIAASLGVAPGIRVSPGLRADVYHSHGASAVGLEPRISSEFELGKRVRLKHTFGLVHQPPAFAIPVPGFQISGLDEGLQRALQSSAGVHVELPEDVSASVTLFQSIFMNMTDAIGVARADVGDIEDNLEQRSLGRSMGMEVYLRRRLSKRLGGFISYTLSRSTRSFGRVHIPSAFDRTHVLNMAVAYDLGRRWRVGARGTYYSGIPSTLTELAYVVRRDRERAPGFYRLDARLEKQWAINKEGAWWSLVFEVQNATFQKEVIEYECGVSECKADEIGPVTIPSIGAEAAF